MDTSAKLQPEEMTYSSKLISRTVDGTKATSTVMAGFDNDTYFVFVKGKKPALGVMVGLSPVIYKKQPEYWEIQVVKLCHEISLPAIADYEVSLSLDGIRGVKGIIVVWACGETEKIDVPNHA